MAQYFCRDAFDRARREGVNIYATVNLGEYLRQNPIEKMMYSPTVEIAYNNHGNRIIYKAPKRLGAPKGSKQVPDLELLARPGWTCRFVDGVPDAFV